MTNRNRWYAKHRVKAVKTSVKLHAAAAGTSNPAMQAKVAKDRLASTSAAGARKARGAVRAIYRALQALVLWIALFVLVGLALPLLADLDQSIDHLRLSAIVATALSPASVWLLSARSKRHRHRGGQ